MGILMIYSFLVYFVNWSISYTNFETIRIDKYTEKTIFDIEFSMRVPTNHFFFCD